MRVVGGRLKGRNLASPSSRDIRPTADRLRESLFNILVHAYDDPIADARVLDLFAGTGALGIEAVSRGAAVRAVRRQRRGGARAVAQQCRGAGPRRRDESLPPRRHQARPGASGRAVLAGVSRSALRASRLAEKALASLRDGGWLTPEALLVVEEAKAAEFAAPEGFEELERRAYDDTEFVFLRAVYACPRTVRRGAAVRRWHCAARSVRRCDHLVRTVSRYRRASIPHKSAGRGCIGRNSACLPSRATARSSPPA